MRLVDAMPQLAAKEFAPASKHDEATEQSLASNLPAKMLLGMCQARPPHRSAESFVIEQRGQMLRQRCGLPLVTEQAGLTIDHHFRHARQSR